MNLFTWSPINKKKRNYFKILSCLIILFIFVAVLNLFSKPLKNYFYILSSPAQKTFFSAGVSTSGFLDSFLNLSDLAKENENLKKENQYLLYKISVLISNQKNTEAIFDFSNSCQEKNFTNVMAFQKGFDGQDIVSIDKGASGGLSEGMPGIDQHGGIFWEFFEVENTDNLFVITNYKQP